MANMPRKASKKVVKRAAAKTRRPRSSASARMHRRQMGRF